MGDVVPLAPVETAPAAGVPDRRAPAPLEPLWRDEVGRVLREERRRTGRTLADVAAEAGVSMQYLSEVERGLKEPSSEILAAVAGALGLRLVDLTVRVSRGLLVLASTPLEARERPLTAPTRPTGTLTMVG